jgi:hypothetical protein
MSEMRSVYNIIVSRPKEKTDPGHRYVDNIKKDLKGIEWEYVDKIQLA